MKNIVVIGDILLDKYVYCSSVKINSEYPNIVFKKNSEEYKLGGAANVAKLLNNYTNKIFFLSLIDNNYYYQSMIKKPKYTSKLFIKIR